MLNRTFIAASALVQRRMLAAWWVVDALVKFLALPVAMRKQVSWLQAANGCQTVKICIDNRLKLSQRALSVFVIHPFECNLIFVSCAVFLVLRFFFLFRASAASIQYWLQLVQVVVLDKRHGTMAVSSVMDNSWSWRQSGYWRYCLTESSIWEVIVFNLFSEIMCV